LEKVNKTLLGQLGAFRDKRKRETNRASRDKKRNPGDIMMNGCHSVTIDGMKVGTTGLEGVQFVLDPDSNVGGGGDEQKRPCRAQGEVAQDKLIIELKAGKAIRRSEAGIKKGGLEWKDSVMAGAVANWALNSLSFKAAGKAINAGLRIQGVRFWFKAEPRRHYKERRRNNATTMLALRDISTASMRDGVFSMELAKNWHFFEKLRRADAIALCTDYGSVSDKSFQATHLRTFRLQAGGTDGAGTTWLNVVADSSLCFVDACP